MLLALLLAACPANAPLPEGDGFVRGLISAQRSHEQALRRTLRYGHYRRFEVETEEKRW